MASVRHNRNRKRGRRFSLLFKLLCGTALVAAATLGATVFFQVETISVTGNSRYTAEEIIAASGVELGDNMFWMRKSWVSGQITWKLPYISEVEIRRSLPSTLVVQVTEWSAAASILVYQDPEEEPTTEEETMLEEELEEEEKPALSDQPWLISRSGKLLEPAPDSPKRSHRGGSDSVRAPAGNYGLGARSTAIPPGDVAGTSDCPGRAGGVELGLLH